MVRETPQKETHAFLSALALRRGEALRLLDHGQLPRGLRHVRLQRHPVQPRVAAPRRDLRHAQDHARLARIALGLQDCLYLGNLDARRDWGHARDYVEAQWRCCSSRRPEDFVIATGEQHGARVRDAAAAELGITLAGRAGARGARRRGRRAAGAGRSRRARPDRRAGRPALLPPGRGRHPARRRAKAKAKLGWRPKIVQGPGREMMREDYRSARRDCLVKKHGYAVLEQHE